MFSVCLITITSNKSNSELAYADTHNHTSWAEWTANNALPTASGDYYLEADVSLEADAGWVIPESVTINLCLNGHFIKFFNWNGSKPGANGITISAGSTLNLYDCGTTEHKYSIIDRIAVINEDLSADYMTFTGGYISGVSNDASSAAGAIKNYGNFNIYGGTIIGNRSYCGTVANFSAAATTTIYGGAIIGNYSKLHNAGVCVDEGTTRIYGGKIKYNYSKQSSGVVCYENGSLTIGSQAGLEPLEIWDNYSFGTGVDVRSDVCLMDSTTFDVDFISGEASKIGISAAANAVISTDVPAAKADQIKSYFYSDNSDFIVDIYNGKLQMAPAPEPEPEEDQGGSGGSGGGSSDTPSSDTPSSDTPAAPDSSASPAKASHGFCVGWVGFIFVILELLCTCVYVIIRFGLFKDLVAKCKLDGAYAKMDLLTLIGLCVAGAMFIFSLIALCVHPCGAAITTFIFAFIICGGFTYFFLDDKGIIKKLLNKDKPQE